jgi:hypothetical protein
MEAHVADEVEAAKVEYRPARVPGAAALTLGLALSTWEPDLGGVGARHGRSGNGAHVGAHPAYPAWLTGAGEVCVTD